MDAPDFDTHWTGRCYCGASVVVAKARPLKVVYCHCVDCRRVTGAPVAAFAAFPERSVSLEGDLRDCGSDEAARQFCVACGSHLAARFSYLDGQVYIPVGCLDQADRLSPETHCHASSALPWLCISDVLPRASGSARDVLTSSERQGS